MRYFLFISFLLFASCGSPYKSLTQLTNGAKSEQEVLKPHFKTALYRCIVDGKFLFKQFHLSGLLFFKNDADTATRVVFQNELGVTYFDFGWNKQDRFHVHFIMDKMNKPALIKTLKKDFELLLVKNINTNSRQRFQNKAGQNVIRFGLEKGFVYYIYNKAGRLERIENADEKRTVVRMVLTRRCPKMRCHNMLS